MALGDAQLLAVELAVTDYLPASLSAADRAGFLPWVRSLSAENLRAILKERKAFTTRWRAFFFNLSLSLSLSLCVGVWVWVYLCVCGCSSVLVTSMARDASCACLSMC